MSRNRRSRKQQSANCRPKPPRNTVFQRFRYPAIAAVVTLTVVVVVLARSGSNEPARILSESSSRLNRNDAPGAEPPKLVTFNRDIAPIVFERCAVCHRPGESAPFDLLTYRDVQKHAEQIVDVTESRFMPPWKPERGYAKFVGERGLTQHQIDLFAQWADLGAPEGDPADLPPLPQFPEGWQLGEPDMVFKLSEPYILPAEGRDAFRNFVIPAPVKETRYVKAVELRPGNAKIAHHGLLKIDRTSASRRHDAREPGPGFDGMLMLDAQDPEGYFFVWTPGTTPNVEPDDMGWRLERGTDLVLQLHMQPTGKPETIQPVVGLHFSDQPPSRIATVMQLYSSQIDIPPGVRGYTIEDSFQLPVDVDVLGIFPHAHYIGKEMKAYAVLPDGQERWLLHIKDWDFNWQDDYRYADPIRLPAGSTIVMRYTYDNSAQNPRNPFDPPKRIVAGDESTDEMGSLTLRVLTSNDADRFHLDEMLAKKKLREVGDRSADAHYELASALQSQGKLPEAMKHYQGALKIKRDHAPSHSNLGVLYKIAGDYQSAISHYREAIFIDPEFAEAYTNLGNALVKLGRHNDAIREYKKALKIRPDSSSTHYNLGVTYHSMNRSKDAIPHFRESIRLKSRNIAGALTHLSWILATHGDSSVRNGSEALQLARAAANAVPDHPLPLKSLSAAHAELGDYDEAIKTVDRAIRSARERNQPALANTLTTYRESFAGGKPLRQTR